jgi:hypothetical protein
MDIENELPPHIRNDMVRVLNDLRAKGVDVRAVRIPTSEVKELYFRWFNQNVRPTFRGLSVFFGVEGYIDFMTVKGKGANLHINHAGKERDFWLPPGYSEGTK